MTTPLRAAAGMGSSYGNMVLIKHGYGMSTRYGHMSKIAVRAGQAIKRGQVIGYVGATGHAIGAHLHYEILMDGQVINPLRLLTKP